MSFTNVYYKRTAATPKACYVCYKPTTVVLATINAVDFLYTCEGHLSDAGFASVIGGEGSKAAVTAEEIAKVKEEWEEKQKRKTEKEKKEKEKKDEDEQKKEESKDGKEKEVKTVQRSTSPATAPVTATHQRYALHRDFFGMRQGEHRKRRQAAQAKELAPRFPGAPRGNVE